MTTSRAQHASALTPRAPVHGLPPRPAARGGLSLAAHAVALLALWCASWIFLAAAVAGPAGRMHAACVRPDRGSPVASARVALTSAAAEIAEKP
ncbi:MAG TPA: hypothetical protein VIR81_07940 [Myxococcales bacterium]